MNFDLVPITGKAGPRTWPSRSALMHLIRSYVQDLRIRKATTTEGVEAAHATFTLRGEPLTVEAFAEADVDCVEGAIRRAAWLIWNRLGLRPRVELGERRDIEQQIVRAAMAGDGEHVDRLTRQLVQANELPHYGAEEKDR